MLKLISLFFIITIFFSPAAFAYEGDLNGSIYTSIDNHFQVNNPYPQPEVIVMDGKIRGNGVGVNFLLDEQYWAEGDGMYSVEWSPNGTLSTTDFYEEMIKQTPSYVSNNLSGMGGRFRIVNSKKITINGRPAYQTLAEGYINNIPAIWIITCINFKNDFGTTYLLSQRNEDQPIEKQIPWKRYNAFTASLRGL